MLHLILIIRTEISHTKHQTKGGAKGAQFPMLKYLEDDF